MTKTYQITSHEYTEIITCATPETCTESSHWEISADDVEQGDIETWTSFNDHPAVRVAEQPEG